MGIISTDPFTKDGDTNTILKHILDIDEGIFQRMMDTCNSQVNYETAMKVLTIITSTRVLDKMPSPLKQEKDIGIQSGIRSILKYRYNSIHGIDDEEIMGILQLAGSQFKCDFEVIRTIKALIKTGRTKHEEISMTVKDMVGDIIKAITRTDYFSTKMLCNMFEPKSYYEKELVKAIKEVHGFE